MRIHKKIKCSGAIFVTKENKILLEDRRKIKKHGEHWSFFGGSIEKGESEEDALRREIKEEMNYKIDNYSFFKKYEFKPIPSLHLTYYMYLAECPDLTSVSIHKKASAKLFTLKQALRLKITAIDKKIIRDVQVKIKKNYPKIDLNLP